MGGFRSSTQKQACTSSSAVGMPPWGFRFSSGVTLATVQTYAEKNRMCSTTYTNPSSWPHVINGNDVSCVCLMAECRIYESGMAANPPSSVVS